MGFSVQMKGRTGDDGWAVKQQVLANVSGALEIDYALGKDVRLTLTGNVTALSVKNWPADGYRARLTLEIRNTGAFTFAFPAGVRWPDHNPEPLIDIGAGTISMVILTTCDGGATVLGLPVGQGF